MSTARGDLCVAEADLSRCPLGDLPLALAERHRALSPDQQIRITVSRTLPSDTVELLLEGAGFETLSGTTRTSGRIVRARRLYTLPDFVGPHLRLLVCGLNPSLYAAETGIPFGRPGNRFWPAARRAGLIEVDRDCRAALARGIGFTDLVKRATRRAAEISADEYRAGLERLRALIGVYRPEVLCFVGLEGFRSAVRKDASAGWIPEGIAETRAYLMPSSSGLNAHATLQALSGHLARAARGSP